MSGTEWFCGVQLGGVKLPAEFPAARNSKSMVHAGTGRWRQKNGRPMLIVGSRLAVYRMAVLLRWRGLCETVLSKLGFIQTVTPFNAHKHALFDEETTKSTTTATRVNLSQRPRG